MNLSHICDWTSGHPVNQILDKFMSSFNEEAGEVLLSLMNQTFHMLNKSDQHTICNHYAFCRYLLNSNSEFQNEFWHKQALLHIKIKPNNPKIAKFTEQFQKILGQIQSSNWEYYSPIPTRSYKITISHEKEFKETNLKILKFTELLTVCFISLFKNNQFRKSLKKLIDKENY